MHEIRRGELASRTSCNPETIRFYEAKGVLPEPKRTPSGHRVYTQEDVQRLTFVLQTRALGFSLSDVLELISLDEQPENCGDVYEMLSKHMKSVESRIDQLKSIRLTLDAAMKNCRSTGNARCDFIRSMACKDH
jgi:MerR family mercuric resistance operon transcriptional regulator